MTGQLGDAVRSGARGEFGALVPVRPQTGTLVTCLRGHHLDLYGKLKPYSHRYRLQGTLCEVCRVQERYDPATRRLAEWAHLDVEVQVCPGHGAGRRARPRGPSAGRRVAGRSDRTPSRRRRGRCRDRQPVRRLPSGYPRLRARHGRVPPPRVRSHARSGRGCPGAVFPVDGSAAGRPGGAVVPRSDRHAPSGPAVYPRRVRGVQRVSTNGAAGKLRR